MNTSGLRTITYNVLQCSGFPKDGARKRMGDLQEQQMPRRFALELELYHPDIITFQEAPEERVVREIADLLKMHYVFFPSGLRWPGALLTRWNIVRSQNCPIREGHRPEDLFTRHWGMAVVHDPEGNEYVIHSVHLHPSSNDLRAQEVSYVIQALEDDLRAQKNVILQGDMNHMPDMPSYQRWLQAGLIDTFTHSGEGDGLSFEAHYPFKRIDYVFANKTLIGRHQVTRTLYEGEFRLNRADPEDFSLSDHLPVLAVFR
ncbi:MAG: endonuclease/exonuclease/phosphatase family protein [bacterium]